MKKIDLGQTITIFANVGVLAGLLLLAYELQQNNEFLSAQARADREVVRREFFGRYMENPALIRVTVKTRNGEPLDEEEQYLLDLASWATLMDWQYIVREYRIGFLEQDVIPMAGWQRVFLDQPGLARFWSENKHVAEPEFIQWMDENIVNR